ncbi:6063_t:CDS:1, partial [Gigaspora margarita]
MAKDALNDTVKVINALAHALEKGSKNFLLKIEIYHGNKTQNP